MVQEKPLKPLCKARLFLLINQASSALWALLCPRRSRAQPLPGCSQARVTLPFLLLLLYLPKRPSPA